MRGDIDTVRVLGGWTNRIEGVYKSQAEAAAAGREAARILHCEWFLKSRLGRILRRNTYGADPSETTG